MIIKLNINKKTKILNLNRKVWLYKNCLKINFEFELKINNSFTKSKHINNRTIYNLEKYYFHLVMCLVALFSTSLLEDLAVTCTQ